MADRQVHLRTCPLCEAMCGLAVHVEDEQVVLIRPDRDDVWSKGYICPKGTTLGHLHHDPDRLRLPLVKNADGEFVETDWDTALRRCHELLGGVLATHGKSAMTAYIGNPTVHNLSVSRYVGLFSGLAQFPHIYSAGTVDQWPKNLTCARMYGNPWMIPAPDFPRTDFAVIMGANPQASQGSLVACADLPGELDRISERGRVVVIDPRRTGTVDHATEWMPIRPGTDAALLAAVVQVLFDDGLVDCGDVADIVEGLDLVAELVAPFTPEAVADTCGIDAEAVRALARDFAAADRAVWYGRIGTCNQEFGTLASWLVDVVNIVTGNFDRPGGLMFGNPVAPIMAALRPYDENITGRWTSRVRGAPEVLGQVPLSCLAEEIATPGEGQIKALVTICGNPVISAPDSDQLDRALPMLDAMICLDNALNETTRHADVILPGVSALEQGHYDEMIWQWAVRSGAKWSDPVFDAGDRPQEWELLLRLGAACAGMAHDDVDVAAIDDGYFSAIAAGKGADPTVALAATPDPGPERLVDLAIRTGPWGDRYGAVPDGLTLERVRAAEHGLDMGPMIPRAREIITRPSGTIDLAPADITADLARLRDRLGRDDAGLVLVSRRHVRSNNSWMHNVKVLVKGKDRCTLLIHPDDAAAAGVADGETVQVTSEAGSIEVPAEVSDEMMPGVVSLPHGWGHDKDGTRQSIAREHAGVNSNLLSPGHLVDVPSGNAVVNGIPVEVMPLAVPAPA